MSSENEIKRDWSRPVEEGTSEGRRLLGLIIFAEEAMTILAKLGSALIPTWAYERQAEALDRLARHSLGELERRGEMFLMDSLHMSGWFGQFHFRNLDRTPDTLVENPAYTFNWWVCHPGSDRRLGHWRELRSDELYRKGVYGNRHYLTHLVDREG